MPDNLTLRLNQLEQQLSTYHIELLNAITNLETNTLATNTRLAALQTAVLSEMGVITGRQNITNTKLDGVATQATLANLLQIQDDMIDLVSGSYSVLNTRVSVLGDSTMTIHTLIALIQAAIGNPTGDASSTLLGQISQLAYSSLYALQGVAPSASHSCVLRLDSSELGFLPDGGTLALWDNLPPTLQYAARGALPARSYIKPTTQGWGGGELYVQSNKPDFLLLRDGGDVLARSNTWLQLGTNNYSIGVQVRGGDYLQARLCLPAGSTGFLFDAVQSTNESGALRYVIVWDGRGGIFGKSSDVRYGGTWSVDAFVNQTVAGPVSVTRSNSSVQTYNYPINAWGPSEPDTRVFNPLEVNQFFYSTQPFSIVVQFVS